MSFALAVLGGLAGGGRALKGIALAKAQAESDLAVEQEKTKAELAKIEAERFERALEKQEALEKEVRDRRKTTVDTHNNLVTNGRHLHTYNLEDYRIFGLNAGLFDQTATVDLGSSYGQTLQGVLETQQRYSFLAEGDDSGRAENRFKQELTEPFIINGNTEMNQWELAYLSHEGMKKRFGPTPTPEQQEKLDQSEAEYKRVFSGLSTMLADIIDKRARTVSEIQLGGEGGRSVPPGAYNVLRADSGVKEIFNNSLVPNEIINEYVILPALNTNLQKLKDANKEGYILKINKNGDATDSVPVPKQISNRTIQQTMEQKQAAGATATEANNFTADSIATATAISDSTGGELAPQDALSKVVLTFENTINSTDERTGLPLVKINKNKATGLIVFEVNPELNLRNPTAIEDYQKSLRNITGNGTFGMELGLQRYIGVHDIITNVVRQKLRGEEDTGSGLYMDFQDTEGADYLPTLESLDRNRLKKQIITTEENLLMSEELLGMTQEYLRAKSSGESVPFYSGFAQRIFAVKGGAIEQARQLGFRVDDAGNYVQYADRNGNMGTDEELFDYFNRLAEDAGFTVDASTGELIPPTDPKYAGAYRNFLEVQFIYMLARSLENPEGGGARLSVADIENMRSAFGSGGLFNDPGLQLLALQRMTQNFSLRYYHLKALERSTSPLQYAAAVHMANNQRFKGFKKNPTRKQQVEAIQEFFTGILRESGPMIDEVQDGNLVNPYEEGKPVNDSGGAREFDFLGIESGAQ